MGMRWWWPEGVSPSTPLAGFGDHAIYDLVHSRPGAFDIFRGPRLLGLSVEYFYQAHERLDLPTQGHETARAYYERVGCVPNADDEDPQPKGDKHEPAEVVGAVDEDDAADDERATDGVVGEFCSVAAVAPRLELFDRHPRQGLGGCVPVRPLPKRLEAPCSG